MNCDVQLFRFSDYSLSPSSSFTRFSDFSDYTILPIVILRFLRFSSFYTILRFFRLYDSSDCYSPIFTILLVLHDSPIIRFFRLLFSDFCDSPRSTRFSNFSDCPPILPIFRLDDSSNYSTNLLGISELEPLKLLFYSMTTYITL